MKKSYLFTVLTALALVIGLQPEAQAQLRVQGQVGLNLDESDLLIGGGVRIPISSVELAGTPIEANPTFEYYPGYGGGFSDAIDVSLFVINLDALYPLDVSESFDGYVGAGLGFYRFSVDDQFSDFIDVSDTEAVINLIGGAVFADQGAFSPFAQVTLGIGDGAGLILKGGILIGLGGE